MSERLTPQHEAEITARAEAATPGPWEAHEGHGAHFYAYLGGPYLRGVGTLNFGEGNDAEADKSLTVNAREDIRTLLAELAAVRAERDQARERVAELERPEIEAMRNKVRDSYAELIAAAEEGKDYEGAFDVQCRLADREAQWRREDEAAS